MGVNEENSGLSMRKIREMLRLKFESRLKNRQIGRSLNISHSTVQDYLDKAKAAGVSWPIPGEWDDAELENRLFAKRSIPSSCSGHYPDWSEIHLELRKKGVTLQLLCEEYLESNPDGVRYSRFCELYGLWKRKLSAVMHQRYKWGEKSFIDYAGKTVPVMDRETGITWEAQIFLVVLGASNFTYCEAHRDQKLRNWINGHIRAFEYFGGVTEIAVPDNTKTGVKSPCRYEPDLNPTYQDWSDHYGVAVIPARVMKPRDKAKVEVGVQIVERWILARLRKRQFFSLQELNKAILELLEDLNNRPMRHLGKSRRELYESREKAYLKRLPERPFEYCQWDLGKLLSNSYHVKFDKNFYSAPYELIGSRVDVRATDKMIEIFYKSKRVGSHVRDFRENKYITNQFHMPPGHRKMLEWTPESFQEWGKQTGEYTYQMIRRMQSTKRHAQQQSRSCLGLMRLSSKYESDRIEAACKRALLYGLDSYKNVLNILQSGLDQVPCQDEGEISYQPVKHENIRGENYYS